MHSVTSIFLALLVAGAHAQCPPSYTFIGGRCLWFMEEESLSYLASSEICEFFGGTLAQLDDCHLWDEVTSYILDNNITYWIGATDFVEDGVFLWPDSSPVQMGAPFWAGAEDGTYEPQDDGDGCVALDPSDGFYFHNEDCASSYSAICQQDSSPCSEPFIDIGGGCYSFLEAAAPWSAARAACQETGGDLAIVDDCTAMTDIIGYIEDQGMSSYFWIGGALDAASAWTWLDGRPMAMGEPFWGLDQTDGLEPDGGTSQNCVLIWGPRRHGFADFWCERLYAPLCEVPAEPTSTASAHCCSYYLFALNILLFALHILGN